MSESIFAAGFSDHGEIPEVVQQQITQAMQNPKLGQHSVVAIEATLADLPDKVAQSLVGIAQEGGSWSDTYSIYLDFIQSQAFTTIVEKYTNGLPEEAVFGIAAAIAVRMTEYILRQARDENMKPPTPEFVTDEMLGRFHLPLAVEKASKEEPDCFCIKCLAIHAAGLVVFGKVNALQAKLKCLELMRKGKTDEL